MLLTNIKIVEKGAGKYKAIANSYTTNEYTHRLNLNYLWIKKQE